MKQQLLKGIVFCAACLVLGAQAQSSGSSSGSSGSSSTPGYSGSSSDTSGQSGQSSQSGQSGVSGWMSRHLSATGHMAHHDIKASQLNGCEVKGSSGENLGTISDLVVNPGSGRMDFAILSLNASSGAQGGATSPSGSSSGTSSTEPGSSSSSSGGTSSSGSLSSGSSSNGKQVAVPWMLLKPASSGATSSSSGMQQQSFTFIGDASKLQSAPTVDQNTDVSQSSWRQSIFSYYGLTQPGASTGGAESPGSSGSSSGSSQTPGSSGNP